MSEVTFLSIVGANPSPTIQLVFYCVKEMLTGYYSLLWEIGTSHPGIFI